MPETEIEIFVYHTITSTLTAWLSARFEHLRLVDTIGDIEIHHTDSGASITITPSVEDGPFTSAYIVGPHLPWPSTLDCGRDAVRALGTVIRVAPVDQEEQDIWIQLSNTHESKVAWNTAAALDHPANGD